MLNGGGLGVGALASHVTLPAYRNAFKVRTQVEGQGGKKEVVMQRLQACKVAANAIFAIGMASFVYGFLSQQWYVLGSGLAAGFLSLYFLHYALIRYSNEELTEKEKTRFREMLGTRNPKERNSEKGRKDKKRKEGRSAGKKSAAQGRPESSGQAKETPVKNALLHVQARMAKRGSQILTVYDQLISIIQEKPIQEKELQHKTQIPPEQLDAALDVLKEQQVIDMRYTPLGAAIQMKTSRKHPQNKDARKRNLILFAAGVSAGMILILLWLKSRNYL